MTELCGSHGKWGYPLFGNELNVPCGFILTTLQTALKKAGVLAASTFQFCLVLHHALQAVDSVTGESSSKLTGSYFLDRVSHC